jgi:hypothetical protein
MAEPRSPITDLAALDALDSAEVVEGYHDGFAADAADPEPGDNRSISYWHGWRNGRSDRLGRVDAAQRQLARATARRRAGPPRHARRESVDSRHSSA